MTCKMSVETGNCLLRNVDLTLQASSCRPYKILVLGEVHRQVDRQIDKQKDRQTDRQTERKKERQTGIDIQIDMAAI